MPETSFAFFLLWCQYPSIFYRQYTTNQCFESDFFKNQYCLFPSESKSASFRIVWSLSRESHIDTLRSDRYASDFFIFVIAIGDECKETLSTKKQAEGHMQATSPSQAPQAPTSHAQEHQGPKGTKHTHITNNTTYEGPHASSKPPASTTSITESH